MNIADFFATVGFKVDTKGLEKLKNTLGDIEKQFKDTASAIDKASQKMEKAMSQAGMTKPKRPPTSPQQQTPKQFKSDEFFKRESTIRQMIKLGNKEAQAIKRLSKRYEKHEMSLAEANARLKHFTAKQISAKKATDRLTRSQGYLDRALKRVRGSVGQLATNWVSAFAVMEGGRQVKNIGQDLEGARAGLASVTDGAEDVDRNFKFVMSEATRLGLNIQTITKDFVKLKAVQGELSDQDIQGVFTGIAEAGTVLQLSQDEMAGSIKAVQQMLA